MPNEADFRARAEVAAFLENPGEENASAIRTELQSAMMDDCGVFRTGAQLDQLRAKVAELRNRFTRVGTTDKGKTFNLELFEVLELGYLLDLAEVMAESAFRRQESRGAHMREDFPERDDRNWLKHTLAYRTSGGIQLRYKPVVLTTFEPKARTY
jgi:succinate dehydrogenase / fumarate reductase flavoprotein subunit